MQSQQLIHVDAQNITLTALGDSIVAAAAEPPPPAIDVDHLTDPMASWIVWNQSVGRTPLKHPQFRPT